MGLTVIVSGILTVDSFDLPEAAIAAQQCRDTYPGKDTQRWRNRTAAVLVRNTTKSAVNLTLYHPDSGLSNGTWRVPAKSYVWLPSLNYTIGDDWGIGFNSKGSDCIFYIDEITTYTRFNDGSSAYMLYIDKVSDPFNGRGDGYIVLRKDPPATEE